jgi:hypothetical protein
MSFTDERLVELLPAVYGLRDGDDGPLHELLGVVSDQLAVLEESVAQLHDDQFVETCAPWVLPYMGELLGIAGLPPSPLTPRAEVAHTIAYRRRKGTAAVLEQLARDVTGLPAAAVELFELLCATQHLNHLRPGCESFLSLGDTLRLEALGGPFERRPPEPALTHTVDVRRIAGGRGRYNIPNVAIFLWRLRAQRLTLSPAPPDIGAELRRFRFSPLGNDTELFNLPQTEDEITHLAAPRNVPGRISRRPAAADLPDFYGGDRGFLIVAPGGALGLDDLVICDLTDWTPPAGDKVAVDPVLGRIAFPADTEPPLVTFHRGFSADIGGGEYVRSLPEEAAGATVVPAGSGPGAIQTAIDALPPEGGVVEIRDSGRYEETSLAIDATGRRVTLRAAVGSRPTLVLDGHLAIGGDEEGAVVIDGLLVTGGAAEVQAPAAGEAGLGALELRHTTLVPGTSLEPNGDPASADPSLVVRAVTSVTVERSIVGGIRAVTDSHTRVVDGILDATAEERVAFAAPDGEDDFGGTLTLEQVTAIGRIKAAALELVSNSILLAELPEGADPLEWPGPVLARRRQDGCVRFTFVPPGSRTPRRHRCQPEREADAARVAPILTSPRYADPGYCQLAGATSPLIRAGADDESELGAFHHLYLPRREAHLRTRLDEHLRFGLEAGVFHAT